MSPETPETSEKRADAAPPRPEAGGRAIAVLVSLGLVVSLLVCVFLALDNEARYAFQGADSSVNLRTAIVVMCIALSVPIATIIWWGIRHRHLTGTGRPDRSGPLVTACVCLALGLTSIWGTAGAVKRVHADEAASFEQSLDASAVEAEGVDHLEWMASSLTLAALGEPEITRESCVLSDGGRGVAPTIVMRAETGGVAAEDLVRVALSFWRAKGYDPHVGAGSIDGMAYVSGTALEDPYVEILVIPNAFGPGVHELSYHGVCMGLPS
ncbi:hypothetical protein J2X63_000739 [Agromyces sp. 3263]|uniref:hypothetical protein n=1 Tax=Agromyces sp. 3263 TaxID=2817750 RepID=UPI002856396E|nr:hypothetical protein [Agromyces sp. 3263]MDR6905053.1 hypothetical protein [Agromyces sp. 3263]